MCMCVCVCVCVCHRCFHGRLSQSFLILVSLLLSFLSSRNTSLHHSSKTPPLLVSRLLDWHAAAYFPQLCLLCPVVLCILFLSHVSIFRTAQWCIYLLPLTSLDKSEFPLSYTYMLDCESLQIKARAACAVRECVLQFTQNVLCLHSCTAEYECWTRERNNEFGEKMR